MIFPLWIRYLLKQQLSLFFLLLGCIYFLYIFIDYATHSKALFEASLGAIALYYLYQFAEYAPMFMALALMLSTIKVLTDLTLHRELVALSCTGLSLKKITAPFVAIALFATLFLYANLAFLLPQARTHIDDFKAKYVKKEEGSFTHLLEMQDGSSLFFHHHNAEKSLFYDLFWVKDFARILHFAKADMQEEVAMQISFIQRDETGLHLLKQEEEASFAQIGFQFLPKKFKKDVGARLYYQLSIPLATLFFPFLFFPAALRFTRRVSLFWLYAFSLCLFICYFTIVHVSVILGESGRIPPAVAVLSLPAILGVCALKKYAKL